MVLVPSSYMITSISASASFYLRPDAGKRYDAGQCEHKYSVYFIMRDKTNHLAYRVDMCNVTAALSWSYLIAHKV